MSRRLLLGFLLLLAMGAVRAQGWEDSFEAKALDPRWEWRAPIQGPAFSLTEKPGWLRVRIPERKEGFNHWSESKLVDEAPQLRAPAPEGDWTLEARIHLQQLAPANSFQVGLFAGTSDPSLVAFGPLQGPNLAGGPKTPEAWLELTGISGFFRAPGDARDLRLQLARTGSILRARLSRGGGDWVAAGACLLPQAPKFVGIIGKTFSLGPPLVFDVDYVRLTPAAPTDPPGRRLLVGIGGEYPTGWRGLLARLGLPHEVLLDHQLADVAVLRRFDLLLLGGLNPGIDARAREAVVRYVRDGGTALVDSRAYPPASVVAGAAGNVSKVPDTLPGGGWSPLALLLARGTRIPAGESRFHFEPAGTAGMQVLARYDGHPQFPNQPQPAKGAPGAPAIWAMPLGRGLLVYSAPAIGASLSWGPTHDPLAEALLQCLGMGRLEPQLVPEGARFGRKQSGLTEADADEGSDTSEPPPFERPRPSGTPGALPRDARLIEEEVAPEFNLTGVYHPGRGRARLLLNYWSPRSFVEAAFEPARARLTRVENGKAVQAVEVPLGRAPEVPFVVKERRDRILLLAGGRRAEVSAQKVWDGRVAAAGAALAEVRCQPVEPPSFGDDFTRGDGEQGSWEVVAGEWTVKAAGDAKMGANPFSYTAQAKETGLATAGWSFWDGYAFDVSVRPRAAGRVGQALFYRDERNHLLFRARVTDAARAEKDGLEIVRVEDGRERVLARRDGCLVKGQWYRLSVQERDGAISAAVDGERVLAAEEREWWGGKIALYARQGQAEFDDVEVRPAAAAPALVELDGSVPRFAGTLDRDTWAGTALQWRADPGVPGCFWRRGRLYGDFDLSFRCDFGAAVPASGPGSAPPALTLLLAPEGGAPESGARLTLRREAKAAGAFTLELARPGASAERKSVTAGERPVLALRREGQRLVALVDGKPVMHCPADTPVGQWSRLGFLAQGHRPRLSGLRLSAGSVLDYCFDRAPADWFVASGTWELASRWPCTPEWSWFAGESRQIAAIWHKRQFAGDVTLDIHVGPRTVDHGDGRPREICRAFNAVLCGDGQDARSGYSFVVGADKAGAAATLSRNGKVVARNAAYRFYGDAHNQWLNVRAEKLGAVVSLWVGDQRVLSWEDPDPLPGGRLGVWTEDNAVMIPRVTIYHREGAPSGRLGA